MSQNHHRAAPAIDPTKTRHCSRCPKARNLKRGDAFSMLVPNMKALSVEPLDRGLFKVKAEIEDSPSMQFGDGGCVVEIICKSGRDFAASPYRRDDRGGGGGGDELDGDDPLPPAKLERSEAKEDPVGGAISGGA